MITFVNIRELTIKKFHEGLLNKEFSATEVAKDFFSLIDDKDREIKAYLSLDVDGAIIEAERVDKMIADGVEVPALAGVPLAIKDNILIEDKKTTAASRILENYIASYDATVIHKLKDARAVFLGKANLDEFAMGSSTENSAFQVTRNPHDKERVPGGSSGGSAAAVAAGFALGALGSDTGGSIRQPAAFCGVVGLKPTYGAVSRHGLIALASSLDQIGPITKTVEDAAILFEAIAGGDELDSTSVHFDFSLNQIDRENINGLTIGIPKEYFTDGIEKEVNDGVIEAIQKFKKAGFKFKEISLPHTKYALSCYYIIMTAEVSTNLARFDGIRYSRINANQNTDQRGSISVNPRSNPRISALQEIYFAQRGGGFGMESRRRILLGTFVLSSGYYDAYYAKAQKVRQLLKQDFMHAFDANGCGVDVILAPVTPTRAFKIGEKVSDPLSMYLSDIFTIPANFAGVPALSLPAKKYFLGGGELPVGFQLIGKHFHEKDILSLGMFYEGL